jgi:hypothetical protein
MLITTLFVGLGFCSSHDQQERSTDQIRYLVPKHKNRTLSTYSEGHPENTGWSCDHATFRGIETQGSKGSLCQGHDTEAFA